MKKKYNFAKIFQEKEYKLRNLWLMINIKMNILKKMKKIIYK